MKTKITMKTRFNNAKHTNHSNRNHCVVYHRDTDIRLDTRQHAMIVPIGTHKRHLHRLFA